MQETHGGHQIVRIHSKPVKDHYICFHMEAFQCLECCKGICQLSNAMLANEAPFWLWLPDHDFSDFKCVSLEMRVMHDAERRSPRSPTPARAQPPPHPTPHSTTSPTPTLASRLFKARLLSGIGFVCVGICEWCAWECRVPRGVGVGAGGCAWLPVPGCEHCERVACITSRVMFWVFRARVSRWPTPLCRYRCCCAGTGSSARAELAALFRYNWIFWYKVYWNVGHLFRVVNVNRREQKRARTSWLQKNDYQNYNTFTETMPLFTETIKSFVLYTT